MNFSRNFGIFCLVVITVLYVYFSFFSGKDFGEFNFYKKQGNTINQPDKNTLINGENIEDSENVNQEKEIKKIKIFVTDKNGKLRSLERTCNNEVEKSCFAFAIQELLKAPTKWEKSKGLSSEIPQETKILSIRESDKNVLIDLSSAFESGGGAESTDIRIRQLIKTANANTKLPVYLYINGKQVSVIGGEGIMIKQPLNERSLDE